MANKRRPRRVNQEDFNHLVRMLVMIDLQLTFGLYLGLSAPVFKAIIKRGYKVPTPIQRKV